MVSRFLILDSSSNMFSFRSGGSKLMDVRKGEICKEESLSKLIFLDEKTLSDEALANFVSRSLVVDKSAAVDFPADGSFGDRVFRESFWPIAPERLVGGSRRESSQGVVRTHPVVAIDKLLADGPYKFGVGLHESVPNFSFGCLVEAFDLALGLGEAGPSMRGFDAK